VIVFHHDDADGRCSAAVVLRWAQVELPSVERLHLVEASYNKPIPIDDIKPGEDVVIVDFSFKPDVMREVRKRTGLITWCDHHVSCKDYDYANDPTILGLRDFTDKGLSGCELTWKHFFNCKAPRFIALLGDYDSWRMKEAPESLEFYEGLKMEDTGPRDPVWEELFCEAVHSDSRGTTLAGICHRGRVATRYRDLYCRGMCASFGYMATLDGHKAYAVNLYRFGSQGFGAMFNAVPVCISYVHTGDEYVVSLYSATVDVSEIARKFGGGGHAGAAGFTCKQPTWIREV
jgi:oligoribonuclease NrnB/cAMP/cGMP phosphodiesterase (DHH superfamily)